MSNDRGMPRLRLVVKRCAGLTILLLMLTLSGGLFLPGRGFAAQDSPEATQLKDDAQKAFLKGDFTKAAAINLEIAEKHPGSLARHYAVQMLGTIYEDNIVDIKKAVKWDQEFLEKYADSRQVPFYKDKIASLEKLLNQEQAFKTYQSIEFANKGDEFMVSKFEALLREHPDFLLKDKVERELGYAYARMDDRKKSALAFQALAAQSQTPLSTTDKFAYEKANTYWRMETAWASVAWAVIGVLWAFVLWMRPWNQLTWPSIKRFLIWPALWLVVGAAAMPLFYSMDTTGYPIVIPVTTVLFAVGLNLFVLFWLLLFLKGRIWQNRPRMLRWSSPILALAMTAGVFYLFIVYHPNGPYIVDQCSVKYDYWRGERRNGGSAQTQGESASHHDRGPAVVPVSDVKAKEGR